MVTVDFSFSRSTVIFFLAFFPLLLLFFFIIIIFFLFSIQANPRKWNGFDIDF